MCRGERREEVASTAVMKAVIVEGGERGVERRSTVEVEILSDENVKKKFRTHLLAAPYAPAVVCWSECRPWRCLCCRCIGG